MVLATFVQARNEHVALIDVEKPHKRHNARRKARMHTSKSRAVHLCSFVINHERGHAAKPKDATAES